MSGFILALAAGLYATFALTDAAQEWWLTEHLPENPVIFPLEEE